MRRIGEYPLWIGNARDARDIRAVLDAGIEAIVDLAMDEPPVQPTRELVYLRVPLVDGGGNYGWQLAAAVRAVEGLFGSGVPTLVACSNGMSRSVAITAAAIASATSFRVTVSDALELVGGSADVHPMLWSGIYATMFTVGEASFYQAREFGYPGERG